MTWSPQMIGQLPPKVHAPLRHSGVSGPDLSVFDVNSVFATHLHQRRLHLASIPDAKRMRQLSIDGNYLDNSPNEICSSARFSVLLFP
jgi:hypothetical protein